MIKTPHFHPQHKCYVAQLVTFVAVAKRAVVVRVYNFVLLAKTRTGTQKRVDRKLCTRTTTASLASFGRHDKKDVQNTSNAFSKPTHNNI